MRTNNQYKTVTRYTSFCDSCGLEILIGDTLISEDGLEFVVIYDDELGVSIVDVNLNTIDKLLPSIAKQLTIATPSSLSAMGFES